MPDTQPIPWKYLGQTLKQYAPLWGGAALLFTGIGVAYALFRNDTWAASQPLLVRAEANGAYDRLGRFASQTDLIAAQETILEMAKNPEVVAEALRSVGPPTTADPAVWPSSAVVEQVASRDINVRAPKGSEFGETDVIYLVAEASSPARAERLCEAVFTGLTEHLRKIRCVRADSIVTELTHARDLARGNLQGASQQLQKLEASVGSDLGELRGLSESVTGEGNTSRVLNEVQRELDAAELEWERAKTLRKLLVRGYEDPQQLLVSGGDLLNTQPTLQRIKGGLIDAQLTASQLSGRYSSDHPRMRSATLEQQKIREELRDEIESVTRAMAPALDLARQKVERLTNKRNELREKLTRLASIRTDYSRMLAEVRHCTDALAQAQSALAEAEAIRSAAINTNLVAALAPPRVGDSPQGPGGVVVTLGALAAGLLFGLGAVFLVAPGPTSPRHGRRWSDYLGGRRACDGEPAPPPTAHAPQPNQPRASGEYVARGGGAPLPLQAASPTATPIPFE